MASRWFLYIQAVFWRFLMRIGMFFHDLASPRSPRPTFTRSIPFEDRCRKVILYFYCPPNYYQRLREGNRLPVIVNFHGGGFTLGCATDDSRWARCIVEEVGAVMVSVGYRRAPENPFPDAVDDGVDALLYLAANAAQLGLDVSRLALSGFSAGGNLAVTVPLRLHSLAPSEFQEPVLNRADSTVKLVDSTDSLNIVALFCWYPILDFEESRDHRRAMSIMPDKTLPSFFTTLFDESYLPDLEERKSPYASPARAPDEYLASSLPQDIFLYICEWDMLMNEGQQFVRRLQGLGKRVRAMMIEKAKHAWDKSPNPFRDQDQVNVLYRDACADMKAIFGET
ncbi:Carboxylesterase family [Aspergillus sclerotialis]|uniref:Carboxylesterase family n=1 Tax=Aspergillus sclerotialis TaxID=2070753 RepID=A0A3A2ZAM1_9EURO|nr:Carboxylesterase family [Aspergillus sclerotialis]